MPIASELNIDTSASALDMANAMFGSGVTIVSATYNGDAASSGTYTGGNATLGELSPSDTGVILSTGQAVDITNSSGTADTNTSDSTSTDTAGGIDGNADLNAVSGQDTFDGALLNATFIPDGDTLTMQLVFSSEEYLEFVNGGVNDAVGIWVNGSYVPLDTGTGSTTNISIDTINNVSNSNLYLDNPAASDVYNTEMDGATVVLSLTVPVTPNVENTITIGIGDGGDSSYDSNLLIMGDSVQSQSIAVTDNLAQGVSTNQVHNLLANDTNDAGNPVTITHINNQAVVPGDTVTLSTGEQITLNADGTVNIQTDGDLGTNTFTYSTVDSDGTPATGYVNIETTATPPNYIVEGTAGNDTIDVGYTGDPEGDMIDNTDHSDASNRDSVVAGAGDDSVLSGDGDDTVFGQDGADTLIGGDGNDSLDGDDAFATGGADSIDGGAGNDTIIGDAGQDTLIGGSGDDEIYDGGPEGNLVDGGTGNDSVFVGDGDDTITGGEGADSLSAGAGADEVSGGDDNDAIFGAAGADTLMGDAGSDTIYGGMDGDSVDGGSGNDSIFGDEGNDTLTGGLGGDTMDGGEDDDLMYGGDGEDTVYGNVGNDTLFGGAGNDFVRGSYGEDELHGGTGDDSIWGGFGDDTIVVNDGFGNDTIDGDFDQETNGDTLDLSAVTTGLTVDLTSSNPENGTFTDGTGTATFSDIENIVLGGGNDTLTLADFGGADIVYGFEAPTVNGDGSLTGNDMLDVSAVTSDFGTTPVNARDVVVTDDGNGNAVLNFPNGESLTLMGIDPVTATDHAFLVAIGIPSNEIVDGTAGDDSMGTDFVDTEGDQTDGTDGVNDTIYGYAGNDTIDGGVGDDTIDGGADDDVIDGGAGADSILGGDGADTITGGDDADTVDGGAGNDSLSGGAGDDTVDGGVGNDTLVADGGNDSLTGFDGDDTFELTDTTGNTTIVGGEDAEAQGDTLDLSNVTEDVTLDLTSFDSESGTVTDGTNTTTFSEIENITLGGGVDTLVLADGGGTDTVNGFEAPTDNGDGTFNGVDQLDVTGLTSDGGTTPIHVNDVVVTDDGSGNAVLNFPNGETLTLIGIPAADASDPAYLVAMGIPSDGILTGTAGDDTIEVGTWLDEDTDVVDGGDALIAGEAPNDDIIQGGAGNDSILAGAGDDDVDGGFDNDTVDGGTGNDSIIGGSGDDSLIGGDDNDTLEGQDGFDTLEGGAGQDSLSGGDAEDSLSGGADDDTLAGDAGRDTLEGGTGSDSLSGGDDQDLLQIGGGAAGDDDTLMGGEGGADDDTLSAIGSDPLNVNFDSDEAGTGTIGDGTFEFEEIENVLGGDGDDTINAGGDGSGLGIDGGAGNDSIVGGDGADSLSGGDDADTITANRNDTVDGGSGGDDNDTLIVQGPATITYDFPGAESGTVTWLDGETMTFTEIENVVYIPCFTPGTLIKTARGEVPVEQLRVGDRALTRDNGYQMIRWIGSRALDRATLERNTALRPIRIRAGALGDGLPERDMVVSPQHRMLISGPSCELWFGEPEVLVAALHLTCLDGVEEVSPDGVTYLHMLFDQHEVVMSDGTWSESFQPGDLTLGALDQDQRMEILSLFPELDGGEGCQNIYPAARMTLKAHQARVLFNG